MPILSPPFLSQNPFKPEEGTLTLSAGDITDAVRTAGEEGDGLTPPAGVGAWDAATNIVTQSIPGALATTGVTLAGDAGATLTKVTDTTAPFQDSQTEVWLLDNSAGATDATVDFDGNATAAVHTGSIWAKAITGTATVSIEGGGTPTDITGTVSYARYSQTLTANLNDNLRITAPAGAVVRFTAAQLETGALDTPFIVTDGSTASRVAGEVEQTVTGLLTATQGAVFIRWNPGYDYTDATAARANAWTIYDDINNRITCSVQSSSAPTSGYDTLGIFRVGGGSGGVESTQAVTFANGTPVSFGFRWTSAVIGTSFNGGAWDDAAQTTVPTLTETDAKITGGFTLSTFTWQALGGNALWYATFAGTLTDADSAALAALPDTVTSFEQVLGALSNPGGALLTSVWPAVDDTFEMLPQ